MISRTPQQTEHCWNRGSPTREVGKTPALGLPWNAVQDGPRWLAKAGPGQYQTPKCLKTFSPFLNLNSRHSSTVLGLQLDSSQNRNSFWDLQFTRLLCWDPLGQHRSWRRAGSGAQRRSSARHPMPSGRASVQQFEVKGPAASSGLGTSKQVQVGTGSMSLYVDFFDKSSRSGPKGSR